MKVIAYIRVSTDKQDVNNQRLEVLEYARKEGIKIDEFMEVEISSRRSEKERRIVELQEKLHSGDTLIVTELSRLGRSTGEVILLINKLIEAQTKVIVLKQGLQIKGNHDMQSKIMVTVFSLFAELERDLISMRTREALAARKREGKILGKPAGTIQKSKFDKDLPKIQELLNYGLSVRKIAKVLGYNNHIGLNNYLKKRNIKAVEAA